MPKHTVSPDAQLETALDEFERAIADRARCLIEDVRQLLPGAKELVYDAYNALSISFATSERLSSAFVAVVVYPGQLNLAFHRGAELADPHGLLLGTGTRIRHVNMDRQTLRDAPLARLVRAAATRAGFVAGSGRGEVVIKKVYARRRPRRRPRPRRSR
jgi:hypothetical protein